MKKLISLILLAISVTILTACASVNEYVVINEKGNVLRDIQIGVDKNDNKIAAALAHDEIYKIGNKNGYKVTHNVKDDGSTLYSLKKVFKPDENGKVNISYDLNSSNKANTLTIEQSKGFFKDTYKASNKFSIAALKEIKNVEYNLTIVLPVEANGKRNSTAKPQENVLVWKANNKQEVDTQFEVSAVNHKNILILVGIAVIIIAITLVIVLFKRHKTSKELDAIEPNSDDLDELIEPIEQLEEINNLSNSNELVTEVETSNKSLVAIEPVCEPLEKTNEEVVDLEIENMELTTDKNEQRESIYTLKPNSFKLNTNQVEIKEKSQRVYRTTAHTLKPKKKKRKEKAPNDLIHRRLPKKHKR